MQASRILGGAARGRLNGGDHQGMGRVLDPVAKRQETLAANAGEKKGSA
jgi:hypothetical protein